mmetsp:Transcript_36543/g.105262  ORF Transcript_36543/g.105262 Transcript_36543/m.105262 type:complete len:214 (+) Transcript_36543:68-709(+)
MGSPGDLEDATKVLVSSWQAVSSDIEVLDGEIKELHAALKEKSARRRALAAREAALRQQLVSQCTEETIVKILEDGCNVTKSQGQTKPNTFEIFAPAAPDDAEADGEVCETLSNGEPQLEEEGNMRSTSADFWEDSLDVVGVVKCGLCGLRFPLADRRGLEAHYAECEAAFPRIRQSGNGREEASPQKGGRFTDAASSPHGSCHDDVLGPALY